MADPKRSDSDPNPDSTFNFDSRPVVGQQKIKIKTCHSFLLNTTK